MGTKRAATLQLVEMQRLLAVDAVKPDADPSERAKLAMAWSALETQRQVLSGHGKPKPVEARNAKPTGRNARTVRAWIEPATSPLVVQDAIEVSNPVPLPPTPPTTSDNPPDSIG